LYWTLQLQRVSTIQSIMALLLDVCYSVGVDTGTLD
jgi:hypothetical protein